MKKILLAMLALWTTLVFANDPIVMLKGVSNNLIQQLEAHKADIDDNHALVVEIIKKSLLPSVDVDYMSKAVVGPQAWRSATPEQQKVFTEAFVTMVTNNYARLFASYSDQTVQFMPIRVDVSQVSKIEVKSMVTASSKNTFKVYYKLLREGDTWYIYDFSIDGISMIESYKSQFAPVLSDSGMSGLISSMQRHNNKSR
jgi:phospholipid transport system substrate-binding protein